MEKKDIRSDLLKSFGMESRAFTWLEEIKRNVSSDEKMYNLTVGSPDGMPEDEIVETMVQQVREPGNHTYASLSGNIDFRKAVAEFYQKRYNVTLDPLTEVIAIPGAKRALPDLAVDFCSAGCGILLPNICYPTYRIGAQLAHAVQHEYRLDPDNNFAPVYADMDRDDCDLLYINYPHNPTCACADLSVFENTVAMARKNGYLVCHDNAYGEILFDGRKPVSFLQAEGAKDVGVEIFTFSKVFNMAGWRCACMVGNAEMIRVFLDSLADYASGVYNPIEYAGVTALDVFFSHDVAAKQGRWYQERRDAVVPVLERKGWTVYAPQGAMYLWAKIPVKDSMEFTKRLWNKARVLVTPGIAYGEDVKDCIRIGLVHDKAILVEAAEAIPPVGDDIYDC